MKKTRSSVTRKGLRVLIATDGSASAKAALSTALAFPWPSGTRVQGVVATPAAKVVRKPNRKRVAVARDFERLATRARNALARRWPDTDVVAVTLPARDGILREAARFSADVIVVGWRGHGAFRRLLMGSVSRGVVRDAKCPVLVVRRAPRAIRQIVIGVDGSRSARRAENLAARFTPSRGAKITVVRVVEPLPLPVSGLAPASVNATVRRRVTSLNAERMRRTRREMQVVVARLRSAGWTVRMEVRSGAPLAELLDVVKQCNGDLLMVGARAARGVRRALLGSVAEGALKLSPVPVFVVR